MDFLGKQSRSRDFFREMAFTNKYRRIYFSPESGIKPIPDY